MLAVNLAPNIHPFDAEKFFRFASLLSIAVGTFTLISWFLDFPSLLQWLPRSTPLHFNSALVFVLLGLSSLFLTTHVPYLAAAFALTALTFSGWVGLEYLGLSPFSIDEMFVADWLSPAQLVPGRLSPNSCVCGVLLSTTLALNALGWLKGRAPVVLMTIGSLVFALGVTALLGYVSGIPAAYSWGTLTHMPIQSALLFSLLGKAVTVWGWALGHRRNRHRSMALSRVAALTIVAFSFALAICTWGQPELLRGALHIVPSTRDNYLPIVTMIGGIIIAFLFSVLGHMALEAQEREAKASKSNALLKEEIALRQETEQRLEKARDEANRANRAKSFFLANISHELRTPLGIMRGFALLLSGEKLSESDRKYYSERISENCGALTRIIDDLLDVTKIESGHSVLLNEAFDTKTFFQALSQDFSLRARQTGLAFTLTCDGALPKTLVSDAGRIRQILNNIIGNAIKFTERGSIDVVLIWKEESEEQGVLQIRVRDSGPGISKEQMSLLFQPFGRHETSTLRSGGTGLGLHLSKQLAQQMHGDVSLLQSAPGLGSIFLIELHLKRATEEQNITLNPETSTPTLKMVSPLKTLSDASPLTGKTILVADDSPDNRYLLTHILTQAGAQVHAAVDGLEALKQASQNKFDAILMDLQMPNMDGYRATKSIREIHFRNPIVALTAHAMLSEKERCLADGFDDYITKPVNFGNLIHSLAKIMTTEC